MCRSTRVCASGEVESSLPRLGRRTVTGSIQICARSTGRIVPPGTGVAPVREFARDRSPSEGSEDRAEEIVDAYLRAGVDQGDWRALDALVNRVYGKPKETIATEAPEPEWKRN